MTLIVSLRIPDGIVIAGDSLATMMGDLKVEADVNVTCPKCGHNHTTKANIQGVPIASTTFAFAQKVFPFLDSYGIGTSGAGQLVGRTIFFAVRELEREILQKKTASPKDVVDVADRIGRRFADLIAEQAKLNKLDLSTMSDDWKPLGFQVVGYKDGVAITVELKIGKSVTKTVHDTSGSTVTGATDLVQTLFDRYKTHPEENPVFGVFSLQDAIRYAEFLIGMTASHQQFSRNIANVGGEIDIALVTPFDGFQWIKQKSLQAGAGDGNDKRKE